MMYLSHTENTELRSTAVGKVKAQKLFFFTTDYTDWTDYLFWTSKNAKSAMEFKIINSKFKETTLKRSHRNRRKILKISWTDFSFRWQSCTWLLCWRTKVVICFRHFWILVFKMLLSNINSSSKRNNYVSFRLFRIFRCYPKPFRRRCRVCWDWRFRCSTWLSRGLRCHLN